MAEDADRLVFYFDFISHNAWLAWNKVPGIAARRGLAFEPVPVLFAGLLDALANKGPAELPPKRDWMTINVLRKARQHGIPIAPPHSHPFNPLWALRLACCEQPEAQRLQLIDALFRAVWAEGRPVQEPEALRPLLAECGLDADTWLTSAAMDVTKRRLRANTDEALAQGVFGVPSVRVRGELFWGFDDLEYLEAFLDGADPLPDRAELEAWRKVQPSAQRRFLR